MGDCTFSFHAVCFTCLATNVTDTTCASSGLQQYLGMLMFGMILHGFGGSILYTVGVGLIDDSVDSVNSPLYIGKGLYFKSAIFLLEYYLLLPLLSKKNSFSFPLFFSFSSSSFFFTFYFPLFSIFFLFFFPFLLLLFFIIFFLLHLLFPFLFLHLLLLPFVFNSFFHFIFLPSVHACMHFYYPGHLDVGRRLLQFLYRVDQLFVHFLKLINAVSPNDRRSHYTYVFLHCLPFLITLFIYHYVSFYCCLQVFYMRQQR